MARFFDVARERTDLSDVELDRLRTLVGDWTLLADLAFADLVLWLPTWHGAGFVAADQVRPTTGPTLLPDDVVGAFAPRGRRPLLDRAMASGRVVPERLGGPAWLPAAEEAAPIRHGGRVIAVLARHSAISQRTAGRLESEYLEAADELIAMVVAGTFPPTNALARTGSPPRVGDGMIRIDAAGDVRYASPNARSAYHRLGLASELVGSNLARTTARLARRPGPVDEGLAAVTSGRLAGGAEVENDEAIVTFRGVPLRHGGGAAGALVLVRDATELRRRDRALIGKDATIREIHHRVKNNLQTVAALLRLQGRRLQIPEARAALEEAVRRVGAIALVHDALAYSAGQRVDADEVLERLMAVVRELAPGGAGAHVDRSGSMGALPSEVMTPLAMALSELLQNSVEHGAMPGEQAQVTVRAQRTPTELVVTVRDHGPGLQPGLDPFAGSRLGLQIVRTLVTEELPGTLELVSPDDGGLAAVIRVPLSGGRG